MLKTQLKFSKKKNKASRGLKTYVFVGTNPTVIFSSLTECFVHVEFGVHELISRVRRTLFSMIYTRLNARCLN